MTAPATKPTEQDRFFYGAGFAVDEIELGARVLAAKVRELKQGNAVGSAVQQKLVAESISKISGEIKALADVVARVTIAHINRRPRP